MGKICFSHDAAHVISELIIEICFHSGVVLRRWRTMSADAKCDIEIVVKANCVLVTNEQRSNVLVTQELVSFFYFIFYK